MRCWCVFAAFLCFLGVVCMLVVWMEERGQKGEKRRSGGERFVEEERYMLDIYIMYIYTYMSFSQ